MRGSSPQQQSGYHYPVRSYGPAPAIVASRSSTIPGLTAEKLRCIPKRTGRLCKPAGANIRRATPQKAIAMTTEEKRPPTNQDPATKDDRDFYAAAARFTTTMIAARSNYMLIFQSMLFSAMAILEGKEKPVSYVKILAVLGLLTSIVWLYTNAVSRFSDEFLWKKLEENDARIKESLDARRKVLLYRNASVSFLTAYPFPALMILAWSYLLWIKICAHFH
jgi:hypothetical protein